MIKPGSGDVGAAKSNFFENAQGARKPLIGPCVPPARDEEKRRSARTGFGEAGKAFDQIAENVLALVRQREKLPEPLEEPRKIRA